MRLPVRTQMRTARWGSILITWSPRIGCHQGLVELAHRRSDLFNTSSISRLAGKLVDRRFASDVDVGAASGHPRHLRRFDAQMVRIERLTLGHHRPQDARVPFDKLRTGLLANATTAFCQPERSRSATAHCEILSVRRCAVITADFAPWISSVRR